MCIYLQAVHATILKPQECATTVLDRGALKVGPGKRAVRSVQLSCVWCLLGWHELRVATDPGVLTIGYLDTGQLCAQGRIRGFRRDMSEYCCLKLTQWLSSHNVKLSGAALLRRPA